MLTPTNPIWIMELLTRPPGLESVILSGPEAAAMERKGFRVAHIPIARRHED